MTKYLVIPLSFSCTYYSCANKPSNTKVMNMVDITPAKHLHINIVIVSVVAYCH